MTTPKQTHGQTQTRKITALKVALGEVVKGERKAQGWSLTDLADASGVVKSSLSKIEHGTANPCLRTLEKLAKAFGVPLVTFMRSIECRAALARATT